MITIEDIKDWDKFSAGKPVEPLSEYEQLVSDITWEISGYNPDSGTSIDTAKKIIEMVRDYLD